MVKRAILPVVLLSLVLAAAAVAERPSIPEVRDAEATHVLVGTVKGVYTEERATGRQGPGTIEGHYLVEVEVGSVERGRGFAPKDLAYVRCWQITKNGPHITPGPSGHGPIPKKGDHVRAYVVKGPYGALRQEDRGLVAVYPNGFEILDAPALRSKATPPGVVYEWPPWAEDLKPDEPGAQPGFDVASENPYRGAGGEEGVRYVRLHVTPGRGEDGKVRRVLSAHLGVPGGWSQAIDDAYVSQSHAGWTATWNAGRQTWSFASSTGTVPMPETGFVFVFAVKAEVLAQATWRGASLRLSRSASARPPAVYGDPDVVAYAHWARCRGAGGAVDVQLRLPRTP